MTLRERFILASITLLTILGLIATGALISATSQRSRQADLDGRQHLAQAISELVAADPKLNRPCFGSQITQRYTYAQIADMPLSRVKDIVRTDPGECE